MHGAPLRRQMRATQRSAFNGRSAACLATRAPNNHCNHDDSENKSSKGSEETANAAGRERHSDKHDDPRGERTPESDHGVTTVPCAPPTGLVEKRGERAALQLGEEISRRPCTLAKIAVHTGERQVFHFAPTARKHWFDVVNMPLPEFVKLVAAIAAVSSVTGVHCGPVFSGPPPHPVGAFLLLDARSASSLVLPTEVAPQRGRSPQSQHSPASRHSLSASRRSARCARSVARDQLRRLRRVRFVRRGWLASNEASTA